MIQHYTSMAEPSLHDLLASHAELRGALILAGRQIRKLNFGPQDRPGLADSAANAEERQGRGAGI